MQFTKPVPFTEAVRKLGAKSVIGSKLNSERWSAVPVGIRDRAMFSATIESVRFLQTGKDFLGDFLSGARETLDNGEVALKAGGRAQFIEQMREFAIAEGLGPLDPEDAGTIKDIRSEKRLGLIFDTNVKAAQEFGNWQQGQDPDILQEFPAQRFIRVVDVQTPRDEHQIFEDQVQLKTNTNFWLRINKDFGVPWGPWGWGCGHDVEDVDRDEAEQLGLIEPGQVIAPAEKDFNDHLKASVSNLDEDTQKFLKDAFGDQIQIEDGAANWIAAPKIKPPPPPQPKPAQPAPIQAPKTPGSWRQTFDTLIKTAAVSSPANRPQLIAQAHQTIQVPPALQAPVAISKQNAGHAVGVIAEAGNRAIAQFVAPKLTAKVSITVNKIAKNTRPYHKSGGIYIHANTTKSVAAHEIMHGVEQQNPELLRKAAKFLLMRAKGEKSKTLKSLTGNPGYSGSERAFEDEWVEKGGSVYAGKTYTLTPGDPAKPQEIRATEILTMGFERLLADPLEFYQNDPVYFKFMVNVLGL